MLEPCGVHRIHLLLKPADPNEKTAHPDGPERPAITQPHRDGSPDALPRRRERRPSADVDPVLHATRECRSDHHGSDQHLAQFMRV